MNRKEEIERMHGNRNGRIARLIAEMPKVELHLHIEGAIPLETLLQLIHRKEPHSTIQTLNDLRKKFTYSDFANFIDIWRWKDTFITDERDFEDIAYQVLSELHKQQVMYVEAFYAPGGYLQRANFSVQGITESLIAGKEKAFRDFGIQSELIIDLIRDHGPAKGIDYLDAVTSYLGKGVIGIGLGGSEQRFPAEAYAEVYHEAKARGFRVVAHAGEAAGADSIWAAVEHLGVERIGHGVRAYEDPQLMALLRERQIPLEMCVLSNVKTGVCQSIVAHPIKDYFEQGLLVTVNSDDPTLFNTSLNQEYMVLAQQLGFTIRDLQQISLNGINASFMSDGRKEILRSQFHQQWQQQNNH
jgi:adenosine deaminase